jgi:hypothetical protein
MRRVSIAVLAVAVASLGSKAVLAGDSARGADGTETKYLAFQVMTGLPGYAGPAPMPGQFSLGKAELEEFVQSVVRAIGTTGDARHKLAIAVGPLCFDMPDDETRRFIGDALAVAGENDVAVAFHLDDSMNWGHRKDLIANADNIETAGWNERPGTGRRADWGPKPTKFPPQMCFNSPAVVAAVKERGRLIGAEVQKGAAVLAAQGKGHLFAGVIAGWETSIGRDFDTGRPLGYRALGHRGFSERNPPSDPDRERVVVVKEFMELWANSLHGGGIAREKIFCHIAFTDQGLRKADAGESYAVKVHFAVPDVAFSAAYRPGFSTYPEGATFKDVYAALARHGSPGWISAEGANVSPTGMPGEPTMETYLGRMFNHGAVLVNVFAWGIGGDAMRDNFFRRAAENPEALAAYGKFLRHVALAESAPSGFSSEAFQAKMRRIQKDLPDWVQHSGAQAQAMPLIQKLQAFTKDKKWQQADKAADALLALMNGEKPDAKPEDAPLEQRLPAKIQKIQQELPTWVQKTGRAEEAKALMKKLDKQLKSKAFAEAEKTADGILEKIRNAAAAPTKDIPDQVRMRLRHELGGAFLVSRETVQKELKLTGEQREKVDQHLRELVPDALSWFQKVENMTPDERQKEVGPYRRQANLKLDTMLKETLTDAQYARLGQLEHQREGLFGGDEIWNELQVTDEQRQQFVSEIQQTQKQIAPLVKEARERGRPDEIRPKVLKMRLSLQARLEALLTDAQRQQWKEMLGKPLEPDALFD